MYFNNIPQNLGLAQYQQSFPNQQNMGYNGGIGSLIPQPPQQQNQPNPQQPAPQMSTPANTSAGLGARTITPLMPYNKAVAGQAMAKGGVVQQTLKKGGVVYNGIAALRGQHPDPRAALDEYDRTFGPEATAELIRGYADGGVVSGPGSGVADLVPGSIDGREDVRIASGEYVIPAWAVAALGDGSTEAGAKVLDAMVARLREEGSELIMGTEPINPSEFLPA